MDKLTDWLASAAAVSGSAYPQSEKDRHYKEILAQMRSCSAVYADDPAFLEVYRRIAAKIGRD